jgi:hypothetical protein
MEEDEDSLWRCVLVSFFGALGALVTQVACVGKGTATRWSARGALHFSHAAPWRGTTGVRAAWEADKLQNRTCHASWSNHAAQSLGGVVVHCAYRAKKAASARCISHVCRPSVTGQVNTGLSQPHSTGDKENFHTRVNVIATARRAVKALLQGRPHCMLGFPPGATCM